MYELVDCTPEAFLCRISDGVYQIDADLPFAAKDDADAIAVFHSRVGG